MPELLGEGHEGKQLLFVRVVVNTIWKRDLFAFQFELGNILRDKTIRQQHELFYELMRLFAFLYHDANRIALLIEPEANLLGREVDRSFSKALLPQSLRDVVKHKYFL